MLLGGAALLSELLAGRVGGHQLDFAAVLLTLLGLLGLRPMGR